MANPFDNDDGIFHVLRNSKGQYSLWPVFAVVPNGWDIMLESVSKKEADEYVEKTGLLCILGTLWMDSI